MDIILWLKEMSIASFSKREKFSDRGARIHFGLITSSGKKEVLRPRPNSLNDCY